MCEVAVPTERQKMKMSRNLDVVRWSNAGGGKPARIYFTGGLYLTPQVRTWCQVTLHEMCVFF